MLLQAQALAHRFDTLLYEDLSLSLARGESVAILGVSGSGKSTLLANLSTLLPPCKGSVEILGREVYALPPAQRLHLLRHELGIIFQAHYLFRGFSALENLQVSLILAQQSLDTELLESLGIAHTLQQNSADLSGGQQQRLSIARVLLKQPRIIFADEPTGNLDKHTAHSVMDALLQYIAKKQGALLIATHDESIARKCDRIYRIHKQGLEALKSTQESTQKEGEI